MNDLIIKSFKGENIYNFVWNNKPCWIANDIAKVLGYNDKGRPIFNCIKKERFEQGMEYELLEADELKIFKEVFSEQLGNTKFASKVVIFYEEGLYGFTSYTEMPIGIEFRAWIRRDVVPTLRKKGYYVCDKENDKKDIEQNFKVEDDKLLKLQLAYKSANMFKDMLDDITLDTTYKFLLIKQIYVDAGIKLPKYIEEERF